MFAMNCSILFGIKDDLLVYAGGGIRTHESLRNRVVGNLQALSKPRTFTTCAVDRAWQPPH